MNFVNVGQEPLFPQKSDDTVQFNYTCIRKILANIL